MPTKKKSPGNGGLVVEMKEITAEVLDEIEQGNVFVFNPFSTSGGGSSSSSFKMTKEQAKKILDETKVGDSDDFIAKFRVPFEILAGKKLNDMDVTTAFMRAMDLCATASKN